MAKGVEIVQWLREDRSVVALAEEPGLASTLRVAHNPL